MTIAEWLDALGAGFGAHACVFEEYGAKTVGDLSTLDEDDIKEIAAALKASEAGLAPLQIKWISKALASEVENEAKRKAAAAAYESPPTKPVPGSARGSARTSSRCNRSEDEDEEEGYEEGSAEERSEKEGGGGEQRR